MPKKLSIHQVKKFVKENSECELLSSEYVNSKSKLKFKCKCGNTYFVTFSMFKYQNMRNCRDCGIKRRNKNKAHSLEYIKDFIENISGSECKLLSTEYTNVSTPLEILCKCGNTFTTDFHHFSTQNKRQCTECGNYIRNNSTRLTNEYIKKYVEIDSKSNCELIKCDYKNASSRIEVKCPCGEHFKTTFNEFKWNNRIRCRKCSSSISKMENDIVNILGDWNIEYIHQCKFEGCIDKRELPFDFYFPQEKICIEADGRQHFEPVIFGSMTYSDALENFKIVKRHDEIKDKFCKDNNMKLIRIPYWERNNIKAILESIF